jgi:hypothetical protein
VVRGCLPYIPICTGSGGVGGDVTNALANAFFGAFSSAVDSAEVWVLGHVLSLITSSTSIDLSGGWFVQKERGMVTLTAVMLVPLLIAGTISAVMHQDLRRLARTWLVALPGAVVFTVLAIGLTTYALWLADAMTSAVTSGGDLAALRTLTTLTTEPGLPPSVLTMLALVALLGALAVWLELIVRSAAVYVAVFFLPLALAGMVWPAASHLARRLLEGLAALVLMKFVIVSTLALGAAAVSSHQGVDQVASGIGILLIAAFAPYVLLRMVPIIEAASIGHLAGLSRQPFRAAVDTTTRVAGMVTTGGSAVAALKRTSQPDVGSSPADREPAKAPSTYSTAGES